MYQEHFGLDRPPFRITPDTRLFYTGGRRGDVLEALVYAITSGEGIVKVVGEVGTGKTMLCRMLEEKLPRNVQIAYLANPSLTPEDILHAIALELGLEPPPGASRLQVMHYLHEALLERHAANQRVVALVEEAQSMPVDTLEAIRLLSNLETKNEKLLQIVLFGQPELDANLGRDAIRQLRERITHSFQLTPLARDDIRDYVGFRLRASGYRGRDVFTDGAYRLIARASEGLTRRVNVIADKAMLAAFAEGTHEVAARHARVAIRDSEFDAGRRRGTVRAAPRALAAGAVGIALLAGAAGWYLGRSAPPGLPAATALAASPAPSAAPGNQAPRPAADEAAPGAASRRLAAAAPEAPGAEVSPVTVPASPPRSVEPAPAAAMTASASTVDAPALTPAPAPATPAREPASVSAVRIDGARAASPGAAGAMDPAPGGGDSVREEGSGATPWGAPASVAMAVPSTGVPPVELPSTGVPPAELPSTDVPPVELPSTGVPPAELPSTGVPPVGLPSTGVPSTDVPSTGVPPVELPSTGVPSTELPPAELPSTEAPPAGPDAVSAVALAPAPAPGASALPRAADPTWPQAPEPAVPAAARAPESPPDAAPEGRADGILLRRLAVTREWLRGVDENHYSIQLLATDASQRRNLESFLRERSRSGAIGEVYVYETVIRGRPWFGVLYGDFATFSAARAALLGLPEELRRHQPFVRNIRDIAFVG